MGGAEYLQYQLVPATLYPSNNYTQLSLTLYDSPCITHCDVIAPIYTNASVWIVYHVHLWLVHAMEGMLACRLVV